MDPLVAEQLQTFTPSKDTILSVGVFDGVHLGHSQLIRRLVQLAAEKNFISIVITFKENPKAVLNSGAKPTYLINLPDRIQLIKNLGVDNVIAISFTPELTQTGAGEFISLVQKYLRMKGMVVGPNFALGRNREGDIKALLSLGKEKGFFLEVIPPFLLNGELVSSTAIRQALLHGDMSKVNSLLGRQFSLQGLVGAGVGRGRNLGFPTANLTIDPQYALPDDGVYVTKAFFDNRASPSVTNIGFSPTFNGKARNVEVYILDFKGDLYQKEMKIQFIERLRGEKKFLSVEELRQQMARDVERARNILLH